MDRGNGENQLEAFGCCKVCVQQPQAKINYCIIGENMRVSYKSMLMDFFPCLNRQNPGRMAMRVSVAGKATEENSYGNRTRGAANCQKTTLIRQGDGVEHQDQLLLYSTAIRYLCPRIKLPSHADKDQPHSSLSLQSCKGSTIWAIRKLI